MSTFSPTCGQHDRLTRKSFVSQITPLILTYDEAPKYRTHFGEADVGERSPGSG